MKAKSLYVVQYRHRDTDELVYRTCDTLKQATEWEAWTAKQVWVAPGTVQVTVQTGGIRP